MGAKKTKTTTEAVKPITHICLLLDNSGSMQDVADDVVPGVNNFIKEQQGVKADDCRFTLVLFNTDQKIVHMDKPIESVDTFTHQTYSIQGMTALNDAFMETIEQLERALLETGRKVTSVDGDGSDRVLFVVWTDGHENSSRKVVDTTVDGVTTTAAQKITARVESLTASGWNFLFLGAGIDAWAAGTSYGVGAANTLSFGASGQSAAASAGSLSSNTAMYRSSINTKMVHHTAFMENMKKDTEEADSGWKHFGKKGK